MMTKFRAIKLPYGNEAAPDQRPQWLEFARASVAQFMGRALARIERTTKFGKPARAARRKGRSLLRNQSGASAIEFAFVATPLFAMIFASLQTAIVFFSQQTLESTAELSTRLLITGQAQSSNMSQSAFRTSTCNKLPIFMKCANLIIDVRNANRFSDIDTTSPTLTYDSNGNVTNVWQYNPGTSGQIVIVRTMYRLPVVSSLLGFDLSNAGKGTRLLVATAVFKSEPYS